MPQQVSRPSTTLCNCRPLAWNRPGRGGSGGKSTVRSISTLIGGRTTRNGLRAGWPLYPIDARSPTDRSYVRIILSAGDPIRAPAPLRRIRRPAAAGRLPAMPGLAAAPVARKIVRVERNRLNLDGVEQRDKHFYRAPSGPP